MLSQEDWLLLILIAISSGVVGSRESWRGRSWLRDDVRAATLASGQGASLQSFPYVGHGDV